MNYKRNYEDFNPVRNCCSDDKCNCRKHPHCHPDKDCNVYNNIYVYPPIPPKPREDVFAQVNDGDLTVTLNLPGKFITLLSDSSLLMQRGGFTVTTTTVQNDTLNFPQTGVYLVNINLEYSFEPSDQIPLGTPYKVFIAIDQIHIPMFVPSLIVNNGVTNKKLISGILSRSFLVNVPSLPAALRVQLANFNFDVSADNSISIKENVINVTKISDIPD